MAGQSARCQNCQHVVVVPREEVASAAVPDGDPYQLQPAPTSQDVAWQYGRPDSGLQQELRQFNNRTNSAASNPGMLRISMFKFTMSFPTWPIVWTSLLLVSILVTVFWSWCCIVLVMMFGLINFYYWRLVRGKFVGGCVNPGVVVSLDPPLLAVVSDLNKGGDATPWNYVRVVPQPLLSMTGGPPQIGQKLPTVCLYTPGDDNSPHFEMLSPTCVNCVTWSRHDIGRLFSSIQPSEWQELQEALKLVPQPPAEGLYKVELQPPLQRAISPQRIQQLMQQLFAHQPDKQCYVAAAGIPPQILQAAIATMAPNVNPQNVLGLALANSDANGQAGMIFALDGVYFRVSDSLRGAFRWQDLWGAGTSRRQFEILLTNRQRLRFDEAFADNGLFVERLLDGVAKSR